MSLKKLTSLINQKNITDQFTDEQLAEASERVKRQHDEDLKSMQEWMDIVKEGIKLMKQEFKSKSVPWPGASNFKSPVLSEASIGFGNKAKLEILRGDKLIKGAVIGQDKQQLKKQRIDRVTQVMNYQINYQMEDWRDDQKRLFYTLPNVGTMFKKVDFNPLEMKNESSVIQYPDFVVNQACTSMKTCRSFTILRDFSKNEVESRQRSGQWRDVDIYPEDSDGDRGSNEQEGTKNAEENPNRFFEQYTFFDFDKDGIDEPYIITVHESTGEVVRVVARYDLGSLIVNVNGRVLPLNKAIIDTVRAEAERGIVSPAIPELGDMELVRVEPLVNIVKYGFLPAPDGTFLDVGYAHLLGAITQAINSTTNQLVDAATLSNRGGGFMARNVRKKMGPLTMKIGEWISTELSPDNLRNGFMPNPSPEPSQTLFALNEKLEGQAREFGAVTDPSGAIAPNTAPTTALAIIQENLIPTSALLSAILDAESKEFQIMFRLNQTFFPPDLYQEILDDQEANAFADFNSEGMDIKPTASAEMASKLQRIQLATIELEQFDRVAQVGGNAKLVLRNYFDSIGSQDVDRIFDESTMTPEEKKQIEELQQQQQLLAQQQQQQIELTQAQVALAKGELDRLNFRTQAEVEKLFVEAEKIAAEIEETRSNVILNLEKAETEQVKNGIDQYTAIIKTLTDSSMRIKDLFEAQGAQPNANTPTPIASNQPGLIRGVA